MASKRMFLCVVLTIKDEAQYLEEWICYHLCQGVDHFFIYDNNSSDNIKDVLRKFNNYGLVTLVVWTKLGSQTDCYRHALKFFGHSVEWLAYIDVDEFLNLKCGSSLSAWLMTVPADVSQIKIPWRNFLFNGHRTRPSGLVIEEFTKAEPIPPTGFFSILGKPIVRTKAVESVYVHMCQMKEGRTVDPLMRPSTESTHIEYPDFTVAQLNHYYYRSLEEFRNKISRGQVDGGGEKVFSEPDSETLYGGVSEVMDSKTIIETRRKLEFFREFDVEPATYGAFLPDYQAHNVTQWRFGNALGHAIAGTRGLSIESTPLEIVKGGWGSVVFNAGTQSDLRELFSSIHFDAFSRQARLQIRWVGDQSTDHLENSAFAATVSAPVGRRKILIIAFATRDDGTSATDIVSGTDNLRGAEVAIHAGRPAEPKLSLAISFPALARSVIIFQYLSHEYLLADDLSIEGFSTIFGFRQVAIALQS